jgi:5-methylcytosine-specific restriction endonuclease McrA
MFVFVLDKDKKPLSPCHPARARKLLKQKKAAIFRRYPFTIILFERTAVESKVQQHRLKIDPGAKVTGLALAQNDKVIVWAAELEHRGFAIRDALTSRRQLRRGRRSRKTRYRQPRFDNRTRPHGWLPPSLMSRVENIDTWIKRVRKLCPISSISVESVKFDMQRMVNPEVSGVQYQQGELFGYQVREYLLEKYSRTCVYCSVQNVPLQVEHLKPKSKGGSDRVSNLVIACEPCNLKKGNRDLREFLAGKPDLLEKILKQVKKPLSNAAAVNATRNCLVGRLQASGLPVETGDGALTKYNRSRQDLPKTHWLDAACVGEGTPEKLVIGVEKPLIIKAKGHGRRQMCNTDKYGFPVSHKCRVKKYFGFQTGDMVHAVKPKGKYMGTYVGRIAVRASGSFKLKVANLKPFNCNYKHIKPIHRQDGYAYE